MAAAAEQPHAVPVEMSPNPVVHGESSVVVSVTSPSVASLPSMSAVPAPSVCPVTVGFALPVPPKNLSVLAAPAMLAAPEIVPAPATTSAPVPVVVRFAGVVTPPVAVVRPVTARVLVAMSGS